MRNQDIIDLFDAVPVLTRVDIDDFRIECGEWTVMQADAGPLREQVFVVEQACVFRCCPPPLRPERPS